MIIWFSLIIPLITTLVLFVFFKKQVTWWEYTLPIVITALFIVIIKAIGENSLIKDTEYWGGWVVQGTYYETWDEKVSCHHPKYRSESYSYPCGTTKSPRTCTGTRMVFDGYYHSYDVDVHPPQWQIKESNGFEFDVSQSRWNGIAHKFGNKQFVELGRDYHSIDGDAYTTTWDTSIEAIVPITTEHSYENRVQCSSSVFNYKPILEKEKAGLYNYVFNDIFTTPSVLPRNIPGAQNISNLNALLGAKKQVRIWVLVFKDQGREIAKRQEAYWKNGNMNELVICVGVNVSNQIKWAEIFSWTKSEELKVNLRTYLEAQEKLDLEKFSPYLESQIMEHWKRRDFKEFKYLQVEQPLWAIIVAYVLSTLISVGCSFFATNNQYKLEE